MKSSERHHLKENELAHLVTSWGEWFESHTKELLAAVGLVVVAAGAVGGYVYWRGSVNSKANAMLAEGIAIEEAGVIPPAPPGAPAPAPQPGMYPTEQAKLEAALAKLMAAADAYPSTSAGIAARYHAAAALMGLGRPADAAKRYQEVIERAGSSIYAQMATLGIAEANVRQGQFDAAIQAYRELSTRQDGQVPVDAVLIQLARTYVLAGKTGEAQQTYTRIVDEFPDSPYSPEARRELDALKSRTA